jgi:hypothetical protein
VSERGVFAVDRGLFSDDFFEDEPFTERLAWLWILSEASWKARRVRGQTGMIWLTRGQLSHSIRFMAEAWSWHRNRVDRFLDRLEKHGSIETSKSVSGTARTVITVCNYDHYQRVALPDRDNLGTTPGQGRDELESRENIKDLPPSQAGASVPTHEGAGEHPSDAAPAEMASDDGVLDSARPAAEHIREVPPNPAVAAAARDAVPGPTRFPTTWELEDLEIEIARAVGWTRDQTAQQFRRFRDWCLIRNEVSHDWLASWRRWCDNPLALQRETARAQRNPQRHPDDRPATGRAARLQELARQHRARSQDTSHVEIQPAGDALCIIPPADAHRGGGGRPGGEVPVQVGGGPGPSAALLRAAGFGAFDRGEARALRRQRHPG